MRIERMGLVGAIAGVLLAGFVAAAGCEGSDDDDAVGGGEQAELRGGFRFPRHRANDAGSVGGGAGGTTGGGVGGGAGGTNGATAPDGGAAADCEMCAKAQRCCAVVEGRVCSFGGTCDPAQPHIGCLTYVVSVRGVWGGNPPAECR
jgi:hypothetical protein